MKLFWTHIWKSQAYRRTTAVERRLIEIRFAAARVLYRKRRHIDVSQQELAMRMQCARCTVSRLEQASASVSLEHFVRAMIELGATDAEIAQPFNAGEYPGVSQLRAAAAKRGYPKPLEEIPLAGGRRWGWRTRRHNRGL